MVWSRFVSGLGRCLTEYGVRDYSLLVIRYLRLGVWKRRTLPAGRDMATLLVSAAGAGEHGPKCGAGVASKFNLLVYWFLTEGQFM